MLENGPPPARLSKKILKTKDRAILTRLATDRIPAEPKEIPGNLPFLETRYRLRILCQKEGSDTAMTHIRFAPPLARFWLFFNTFFIPS
jgi:hypothetical protein